MTPTTTNSSKIADRVSSFSGSIWDEFTKLSIEHKTVNLGQGFTSFEPPSFISENLSKVVADTSDIMRYQYAPSRGDSSLLKAIAKMYEGQFGDEKPVLDPQSNILVTNGCSAACYMAFAGLLNPGDEIVIFEPFYGIYRQSLTLVGANIKYVPMKRSSQKGSNLAPNNANNFMFEESDLRAAINSKTKMILVNTPHNPTGKTFSKEELQLIANIAKEHDLLVLADEVYDYITFGEHGTHNRIASLEGMFERTVTCSSFGKTFSATGLKTGYVIGPAELVKAATYAHAYSCFCCPTPIQRALALSINDAIEQNYFPTLREMYLKKKQLFLPILEEIFGAENVLEPNGAYFIVVDISHIDFPYDSSKGTLDFEFARFMIREIGVTSIPLSAFYAPEHANLGANYVRFAFCKPDEMLKEAGDRMRKLKNKKE